MFFVVELEICFLLAGVELIYRIAIISTESMSNRNRTREPSFAISKASKWSVIAPELCQTQSRQSGAHLPTYIRFDGELSGLAAGT